MSEGIFLDNDSIKITKSYLKFGDETYMMKDLSHFKVSSEKIKLSKLPEECLRDKSSFILGAIFFGLVIAKICFLTHHSVWGFISIAVLLFTVYDRIVTPSESIEVNQYSLDLTTVSGDKATPLRGLDFKTMNEIRDAIQQAMMAYA